MSDHETNSESELPATAKSTGKHVRKSGIGRLLRLSKKELLEILRDRRTIITLVLMPILVYPLMGMVIQRFMVQSLLPTASNNGPLEYRLGFENQEDLERFWKVLEQGNREFNRRQQLLDKSKTPENGSATEKKESEKQAAPTKKTNVGLIQESVQQDPDPTQPDRSNSAERPQPGQQESSNSNQPEPDSDQPMIQTFLAEDENVDLAEMVANGTVDMGVRILSTEQRRSKLARYELIFREGSKPSRELKKYIEQRLEVMNKVWLAQAQMILRRQMQRMGRPFVAAPTYVSESVEATDEKEDTPKPSILTFVPLMLVLMTITGAVYPAIDLTAGERERGTMEILVAAPVPRMSLLFGKFVAVLAVALLTAMINMFAMLITVYSLGLDKIIFGADGLTFGVAATVLFLLMVFAAFFASTLLGVTSFARSFKEAQAYLIPLMLIALAPGLISLTPNLEMGPLLAITPLVNIVLTARDLLAGNVDSLMFSIAIISTMLYGALAMSVAAKVFGADSVLTGGGSSWSDMFRRSSTPSEQPTIASGMLFLAVLFPAFIVVKGLASRAPEDIPVSAAERLELLTRNLTINGAVTVGLFVILPMVFVFALNLRRRSTFYFYRPRIMALVAALLVGCSVWTIIYEVNIFVLSQARIDSLTEMFESLNLDMSAVSLPLKLVCLAIAPAVCEEITFRGFLMSAFRKRSSAVVAVLSTAVLFGLFHVFVGNDLFYERIIPTTIMGILLGWICVKTGSIWPGVLLHVIHNGLMLSIGHFEESIKSWGVDVADRQHLPLTWILIALVPLVLGLVIFYLTKPTTPSSSQEPCS